MITGHRKKTGGTSRTVRDQPRGGRGQVKACEKFLSDLTHDCREESQRGDLGKRGDVGVPTNSTSSRISPLEVETRVDALAGWGGVSFDRRARATVGRTGGGGIPARGSVRNLLRDKP